MTYMLTHVDLTTLGFCVNISVDTAICERPTVGFSNKIHQVILISCWNESYEVCIGTVPSHV